MLQLDDIHTFYGKSHIIQGLSLKIDQGEFVSLLGRNGAGKTTTLRSIIGLNAPREGRILLQGEEVQKKRPFEISQRGVGYVPQGRRIFSTLTVLENLNIAVRGKGHKIRWSMENVFELFPSLRIRKNNRGNELSGGEQQMLTIGRALMTNPKILLVDEPTEGLAPIVIEEIGKTLQQIKMEGITCFLVEQNLEMTYPLTDRYYILQQGLKVYQGTKAEFETNEEVKNKYLGI
jgi:branched-chain amino acid transport system ATP-binding protein